VLNRDNCLIGGDDRRRIAPARQIDAEPIADLGQGTAPEEVGP
jgi:hypothetical protein